MDAHPDGQIDWKIFKKNFENYKCSLNKAQPSVLLVPVPIPVNAIISVWRSIQHKTYYIDQKSGYIWLEELVF